MRKYIGLLLLLLLLLLFVLAISCTNPSKQSSKNHSEDENLLLEKITNTDFKALVDSFAFTTFPIDLNTTPLFADGEVAPIFHKIPLDGIKKFLNSDAQDNKGFYTGYAVFEKEYIALIYYYTYSTLTGGLNYNTCANLITFDFDGKTIGKIYLGETNTRVNSSAQRESQSMVGSVYSDKPTTIKLNLYIEDEPSGTGSPVNFSIRPNGEIVIGENANASTISIKPSDIVLNIKKLRQTNEINTTGFTIEGEIIYASVDSNFVIANFTETYTESNYLRRKYAIATNTSEKIEILDVDKDCYIQVQSYLNSIGLVYNFFYGNFTQSFDFQGNGSKDFVRTDISNFRTDVNGVEQIVLFDGNNKLTPTNIIAHSNFSSGGEWEGIVGQQETFKFKEENDKPALIMLEHYNDDFLGEPDKQVRTQINYILQWRWSKESNEWETGLLCSDCGNSMYSNFTDKLIFLTEENNGFVIYENCQNGGPNFFQLKKSKTELSEMYIVDNNENENDGGYETVIHIAEVDSNTKVLYVGKGEKMEANTNGNAEIGSELSKWDVKNDTNNGDIIRIKMGNYSVFNPFTSEPKKYKNIPCNQK